MLKVDFHVHTKYSHDSKAEVSEVLQFAKRRGLNAIAITDHDNLQGSREAERIRTKDDVQIIPGIEYTLPAGKWGLHIIALNIDEYISFSSIAEAITKLKKLNATLILPHPFREGTGIFDHISKHTITKEEEKLVFENIDYVEAINMKDVKKIVEKNLSWVKKSEFPVVSGTDSHWPEFIGMTFTEIESISGFLKEKNTERNIVNVFSKSKAKNIRSVIENLETAADFRYKAGKSKIVRYLAKVLYNYRLINDHTDRRLRSEAINLIFRDSNLIKITKIDGKLKFN